MPVGSNGIFQRVWRFVDRFAPGEDITRSDLDVAFNDVEDAINQKLGGATALEELKALLEPDENTSLLVAQIRDSLLFNIAIHARELEDKAEELMS